MAERPIHVDSGATTELRKGLRQATPDADTGQVSAENRTQREHGHDGVFRTPIVPTLQRGNAVRDALRHTAVFLCQVDWGSA
nr:DUF1534 domain-containing protein [Pseudomonas congelans]